MHPCSFFIMVLLVASTPYPATAEVVEDAAVANFVLDLLRQEYWDGDWSIANKTGEPNDIVRGEGWTCSKIGRGIGKQIPRWCHIRAKLDIVGFRNMCIINGTPYVQGEAVDNAIVIHSAWYTPLISLMNPDSELTIRHCNGIFDSLTDTVTLIEDGDEIIATQRVVLKWHFSEKNLFGDKKKITVEERKSFSVRIDIPGTPTDDSPENFTTRIPDVCVPITIYNRSVAPVTYIYIPPENDPSMKDVMITRATYNGSTISRYDQTGWVMTNPNGTEYVEFIDDGVLPSWDKDENQSVIDHCGRFVTVFEHPFDISLLNISLYTPYETRHVTNYSTETVSGNAEVNVPLLKVITLLIISFLVIIIILKVIKRVL